MKIALIGCGAIGQFLLRAINQDKRVPDVEIVAILDEREDARKKYKQLSEEFSFTLYQDLDAFLQAPIDMVIECATIETVQQYAEKIIRKKDLLVISIGAFVDRAFFQTVEATAKRNKTKVYLPTGAIGGLDVLQAANSVGKVERVVLTSRKPLQAFGEASATQAQVLFKGAAKEAIKRFPQNANVAIALTLAGLGADRTEVKIVADPSVKRNIHTIDIRGDFGRATMTIENNPSPTNPKTSYLTSLSILSTIQSLQHAIRIG